MQQQLISTVARMHAIPTIAHRYIFCSWQHSWRAEVT
jgi:hypothetical protein